MNGLIYECTHCGEKSDLPHPCLKVQSKFRHHCKEWDFLEIDETYPEFEACLCFKTAVAPEKTGESK